MPLRPGMITYEVTATVRPDLCERYERFMRERHIPELLETGAFAAATLSRSDPGRFRIRYEAHGQEALARYLAEHAPRLRRDAVEQFPEGVELSREEWTVVASWSASSGEPPA
jgi:hypothetical protein